MWSSVSSSPPSGAHYMITPATNDTPHNITELMVPNGENSFSPFENPHSLISFETFTYIEHVLFCYFSPVIFCVGVPTNVLNCVVFARQGLKDRMNLCLFCLSLADLLYVMVYYGASGLFCFVQLIRPDLVQWWKWSGHEYTLGLNLGSLLCSGCLTMIIAVERCVCVLFPLKAGSLMTTRAMGLVIVCVVSLVHLLCAVFPLKLDVVTVTNPFTNATEYAIVTSPLYHQYPALFDVIEYTIVANVIPLTNFSVVTLATLVTVLQLRRMMAWRSATSTAATARSSMTTQQTALVKMLVIVSAVFLVTSSPFVVFSIISIVEPEFSLDGRYHNMFLATHAVHLVVSMANSSINFFVYVKRSSRFRQELRALCGLPALRERRAEESITQDTGALCTD